MKKSILALAAFIALAPAAAMARQQEPIRVGGNVTAPERIRYVAPVYPEIAMSAQVQGVVILEAVVGTGGSVLNAKVLKSIPLLDQAALDAVKQWAYTQTTLNGVPVPVIMTVTVNFSVESARASSAQSSMAGSMTATNGSLAVAEPVEWNGKQAIRVGSAINAPERVKYVAPAYPQIAESAGVTGIVIVEAIVDESGNVAQAKVLKSIPLLDQAATDAVMQWKYTPTLLNGVAVPVAMTVTVNFSIGG